MIKVFLLIMIISMPGQKSVRYNAFVYPTEEQCITARDGYNNAYESKNQSYKDKLVTKSTCIPFDAFPMIGLNYSDA